MTKYTVTFETTADWAGRDIGAVSPDQALAEARRIADLNPGLLDFQSYGHFDGVEHIQVWDDRGQLQAAWRHPDLLLRLAASELLAALREALIALRAAPDLPVLLPTADGRPCATTNGHIAHTCALAIARAERGPA